MDVILNLLCLGAFAYQLIIFAAIILSWFPIEPGSTMESVHRFLHGLTEPVLGPVRRALPPIRLGGMGLDLSPIIVLIGLQVVRWWLCR